MIIDEKTMLEMLDKTKKPMLIEPDYRRKYPPLGLAKISGYLKQRGINAAFARGYDGQACDAVFITSLFTYDSGKVLDAVNAVKFLNPGAPVIIGGIYASLMTKHLEQNTPDVFIFKGYSKTLDQTMPDYDRDWLVDDIWNQFSFTFTSRGCPNKCGYCAVWRIEPGSWVNPKWKESINSRPCAMISDNNLSSMPRDHLIEVIEYLQANKKKVVFDNGFDCKLITDEMAKSLAGLKFTRAGMRLAFDRIEEDKQFRIAVKRLLDAGIAKSHIMAYVLFNFKDTPKEASYRMNTCKELGIRPYPQQYTPLNTTSRGKKYIGRHWTPKLLKAFRYFWLMAGFYNKSDFETFAQDKRHEKYGLADEDWAAWRR